MALWLAATIQNAVQKQQKQRANCQRLAANSRASFSSNASLHDIRRRSSGRAPPVRRMRSRSAARVTGGHTSDVGYVTASGRRSAHASGHVSPASSLLLRGGNGGGGAMQRPPSTSRLTKLGAGQSTATNPLFIGAGEWSSDGSNGGLRSPPPELVERAGLPPANLHRPTATRSAVAPPFAVKLSKPRPLL